MVYTLTAVFLLMLISVATTTTRCRQCEALGQRYRGHSRFQLTDNCLRYNCICNCDGSWNCPIQRPTNVCSGSNDGGSNSNCKSCKIDGRTYQGNSRFQLTNGCYRYNCDCNCDGSYKCPSSRTQNIC